MTPNTQRAALAGLAAVMAASAWTVRAAPARDMLVSDAWSRPTPAGLPTGVVYLTLTNKGAADRLMGATTPIAQAMQLHRSSMSGGVMSMTPVPGGLEIPAGGRVVLAPNGYHFMLTGLKKGLSSGDVFPASLAFAHAGRLTVRVTVRTAAPEGTMGGMKMR